jgi:hypothetical protein
VKVTIDNVEYPALPVGQWSYDDADHVKRVTGLSVGQIPIGILQGDAMAFLAFAVVGFRRIHPDRDPLELRSKPIDLIVVNLEDEPEEATADSPPAADAGRKRGAAKASRRKT